MRARHRMFHCLARLAVDRAGGTAIFMSMAMLVLVASLGTAIDSGRGYLVRSHLSQALDAAALAGGRAVFSANRDADIRMFFNANFPATYLDSVVTGPTISVDANGENIVLSATAVVPTTFMRVIGLNTMTVQAETKVKRTNRGMELVLVMDNTGSMAGAKVTAMKNAATNLVNILYGSNETQNNFWVALVPYVATVNIGTGRTAWLTGYTASAYSPGTWKGCVEARVSPYEEDQAEALPSVKKWAPFLWITTKGITYTGSDGKVAKDSSGNTATGDNQWTPINQTASAGNAATGPNLGCGPAITPLQPSKAAALAAIAGMDAWSRGGTMANLGLAWGWRVLSPTWRGQWGGTTPSTLPMDYNTALIDKVVVMLTDGVNQWYDYPDHPPGCAGIQSCKLPADADYTAYGRLSEKRLGTNVNGTATTVINTRMTALCTAMKQKGIIIYTIVLQENDAATENLYKNCATKPEYAFLSPSASDLAAIFQQIATQLSNLRVAQ
ncbi:MAG: pilus assembly protein TadG-related protein [Rhodospirillales bacterium]